MEREIFYNDLNETGKQKIRDLYNCTDAKLLQREEPITVVEYCQWEQFVNEYKPIKNPLGNDCWDGYQFDDHKEDLKLLKEYPDDKIWTLYTGEDNAEYIEAGFNSRDVIGWFVTEKSWVEGSVDVYCVYEDETDNQIEDLTETISSEEVLLSRYRKELGTMKRDDPVSLLTTGQELVRKIRQQEEWIKDENETLVKLEKKLERERKRWKEKQEYRKQIIKEHTELQNNTEKEVV